MGLTLIEWTARRLPGGIVIPGYTFNPWLGCSKVSDGCGHCYIVRTTPFRVRGPPSLLVPGVRERLDQAEFVQASLWIIDDLGESLCLETVRVPRALIDGSCREVLRQFWLVFREAEDPAWLAWAKDQWQRMTGGTLPFPELPPVRRARKEFAAAQPKQIQEGSAEP